METIGTSAPRDKAACNNKRGIGNQGWQKPGFVYFKKPNPYLFWGFFRSYRWGFRVVFLRADPESIKYILYLLQNMVIRGGRKEGVRKVGNGGKGGKSLLFIFGFSGIFSPGINLENIYPWFYLQIVTSMDLEGVDARGEQLAGQPGSEHGEAGRGHPNPAELEI